MSPKWQGAACLAMAPGQRIVARSGNWGRQARRNQLLGIHQNHQSGYGAMLGNRN